MNERTGFVRPIMDCTCFARDELSRLSQRFFGDEFELISNRSRRFLTDATLEEIVDLGISISLAESFLLARDIGRELWLSSDKKVIISSPEDAASLLLPDLSSQPVEKIFLLILDQKQHLLAKVHLSTGILSEVLVGTREIYKEAFSHGGKHIILAHNHPSGSLEISDKDKDVTMQVIAAGRLMQVELLDHLIIGDNCYLSIREKIRDLWNIEDLREARYPYLPLAIAQ